MTDVDALRDRVARDLDERVADLRARFGSFPVHETRVDNDPERFQAGVDMAAAGWRGDAGAWVEDADGRVLLIRHAAADGWGVPGGGHDPGESFAETARREVREETGVEVVPTDVWRGRRKTFVDAETGERLQMLTVRFEGRTDAHAPALDVGDDEVVDARWFAPSDPPDNVTDQFEERVVAWAEDRA